MLAIIKHPDGDIHVGTEMFCTRAADALPNTLFADRIRLAEYERGVTYFFWNRSSTAVPVRSIDLVNTDAYFDSTILDAWKHVEVELYVAEPRTSFDDATRVGTIVVNNIDTPDEHTFRLNGYSYLEVIDKVITGKYSDSVTNTQYRNAAKPISLGRVTWAYPINHRLNNPSGSTRGAYDIADSYFEELVSLRARGAPQNESQNPVVTNSSPQYFVTQNSTDGYGFLLRDQSYRLAADVKGQLRIGDQLLAESTFTVDWEDAWTVYEGDAAIVFNSPGSLTINGYGTDKNTVSQSITTVIGQVYLVEVDAIESSSGVWSVFLDGTAIRSWEDVDATTVPVSFQATATSHSIAVGLDTGASGSFTISAVRCSEAYRINNLEEFARFIASRSSLADVHFDYAACAPFAGTPLAFASTDEVRGLELLRLAERSLNVSFYQNLAGVLKPVQLVNPGTSTEEYTIYETDVDGVVEYEPDLAPGLTTRFLWGRNYNIHSIDDVAGLSPGTAGAPELREALQREWKTVTSAETPISTYEEASDREPLPTLHTSETEAQNTINYLFGELYYEQKGFYTLRARVSTIEPYTIEPGNIVKLYNWRYGLSSGKLLFVVYAKSSFHDNYIDLVLWG